MTEAARERERARRRRRRGRGQNVALQHLAAPAAAGDGGKVDLLLGRDLGRRRRGRHGGAPRAPARPSAPRPGREPAAGAAAPPASWPSSAPIDTVWPVSAVISLSTPAPGAFTSSVTLSVSSSTSGSSARTASPAFLNHLPTVASVIDSPSVGTRISIAILIAPQGALLIRVLRNRSGRAAGSAAPRSRAWERSGTKSRASTGSPGPTPASPRARLATAPR